MAKRRQKRSRYDSSSSESSDSDSDAPVASKVSAVAGNLSEDEDAKSDFSMDDVSVPSQPAHTSQAGHVSRSKSEKILAGENSEPVPRNLEQFLSLCTEEYGDDLNKLRESGFGPGSLNLLIDALKNGINVFDKHQQDLIIQSSQ